jgi:hypothetical protein
MALGLILIAGLRASRTAPLTAPEARRSSPRVAPTAPPELPLVLPDLPTPPPPAPPIFPPPTLLQALAAFEPAPVDAESLSHDLALLEEKHIELARHHSICSRFRNPIDLLKINGCFSPDQLAFIDQVSKSRSLVRQYHAEQVGEFEDECERAIRRCLTGEQLEAYGRILIRMIDY